MNIRLIGSQIGSGFKNATKVLQSRTVVETQSPHVADDLKTTVADTRPLNEHQLSKFFTVLKVPHSHTSLY